MNIFYQLQILNKFRTKTSSGQKRFLNKKSDDAQYRGMYQGYQNRRRNI